jgi:hypothetical protein
VVVANAGDNVVDVTVERGGMTVTSAQVQPDSLATLYLPWVPQLKGPDFGIFTEVVPYDQSVLVPGGAYHLTTTFPVTVYQFSALEYAPTGGPPGKDWSSCPGNTSGVGCFSYSNDASLLLPSTALTGTYRVAGMPGWPLANLGSYMGITAITDGTSVTVALSGTGSIAGGSGVTAVGPGGTGNITMNRGDVAILLGSPTGDQSGTVVGASNPIQLIHGHPCRFIPDNDSACDHIEESVFPAETLGKRYFVTTPTGPNGTSVPHVVRIYGNFDGTQLSYPSGMPPGAPTSMNAGEVADLGQVATDFEIVGDQSFAVGTFHLAATIVDPNSPTLTQRGDPDQSLSTAVEQYRVKYIFLAPLDYDVNFVSIVQPMGAMVTVDGMPSGATPTAIGNGFGVARVQLGPGVNGAHVLESSEPVGIQVEGYGSYTSYYYPGGSDLKAISPPPPVE